MGRHQESRVVSQSHRELADSIQETLLHGRKTREMSSEGEDEDRMGLLPPDWMAHAQASVLMMLAAATMNWSGQLRYALMTTNQQAAMPTSYAKLTASSLQLFAILCECAALSELSLAVGVAINGAVLAICRLISAIHSGGSTSSVRRRCRSIASMGFAMLGLLVLLLFGDGNRDDVPPLSREEDPRQVRFLTSPELLYHLIASLLVIIFALSCIADTAVYTNYAARVLPIRIEAAAVTTLFLTDANALVFAFVAGVARANVLLFEKCLVELLRLPGGSPWLLLLGAAWLLMIMLESRWLGCAYLIDVGGKQPEWRVFRPYHWTWIMLGVVHGALLFGDLPTARDGPRQAALIVAFLLVAIGVVLLGQEEAALAAQPSAVFPHDGLLESSRHPLADASQSLLDHTESASSSPPPPTGTTVSNDVDAHQGQPASASSYSPPAYLSTI